MRDTFFANIKKALSVSPTEGRSAVVGRNLDVSAKTEIQPLTIHEYSAVAGGPQVRNDPEV